MITGMLTVITLAALSSAAVAADAANGETIAKRWCAACHVVASDQQRSSTQGPPFSAIAEKPGLIPANLHLSSWSHIPRCRI